MSNFLSTLCHRMAAVRSDNSGSVGIMFALFLIPTVMCMGLTLDYIRMSRTNARLSYIADSVTLAAVAKTSLGYNEATTMPQDGTIADATTEARNLFNAELATTPSIVVTALDINVQKVNGTVKATANYTALVNMSFTSIMGVKSRPVSGTATATNGLVTFIDFYMLLDNSPSMGVAATPADIAKMVANTPDQCAFACHDLSTTNNYYNLARRLGVTLRIDVLRSATQSLTTTATGAEQVANQFRMAVYTFNNDITTIAPLTPNLGTVATQASAIDLMPVAYQGVNNDRFTNFTQSLYSINSAIPTPGDGSSSASPQKVLFWVTDGVSDYDPGNGGRSIETVRTANCDAIKRRGIKVAVLYTTYLPLPTNSFYNTNVAPWTNTINPTMKACASPGLFFEVSPSQGVSNAMNALFLQTVSQAHLTQ